MDYADLTFPVTAGTQCYHDGLLYYAKQDIQTAEAWTAAHWQNTTVEEQVTELKNAIHGMNTATASDVGKALSPKTVSNGEVTEWKFVSVGGGGSGDEKEEINTIGRLSFINAPAYRSKILNSYRLNESDGYCTSDNDYTLLKYEVTPGECIRVVSDDRFQFQTYFTTNTSGTNYLVGSVYGDGEYVITVPETATWLIVSTTKTNSKSGVYLIPKIDYSVMKYNETNITENKYIVYTNGSEGSYNGLRYITFNVRPGYILKYDYTVSTPDPRGVAFYKADGTYISGVQTGTASQDITVPSNAAICKATISNTYQIYIKDIINTIINDLQNIPVESSTDPLAKIKETVGFLSCFLHVGCIGDSLASGEATSNEGGSTAYHDIYEHSWGQYLARATGNTYYNFSNGGLTTKTWMTSQHATNCFDGQHLCEAYIIGLGENDAIAEMTVGTASDINLSDYTQNADTYYGNYGKIIQRIKAVQPKAKIFALTNPQYNRETAGYNDAVRGMSEIFDNVYIVDLYKDGRTIINSGFPSLCKRNGHYNAIGYQYISRIIATYIDWIIENNPDDFNQIEFIGTQWEYTKPS